jgi:hypothetical protein
VGIYLAAFVIGGAAGTWLLWTVGPVDWAAALFAFPFAGCASCCGAYLRASLRVVIAVVVVGSLFFLGLRVLYPLGPFLMVALGWLGVCAGMVTGRVLGM